MIPVPTAPEETWKRADRLPRTSHGECIICGTPIKDPTKSYHVLVHHGGSTIVTEEEYEQLESPESAWYDKGAGLGTQYIGATCYKKYPEVRPYCVKGV